MNLLETTIAAVIATIVSGTISVLISHRKQRQLEEHKAALQAELERSKLQMQNDLQIKFFEYQTKFSSLHQEQAYVIKELYGLLGEANEYITQLVSPTFNPADTAHAETTTAKYNKLAECFVKNRIYLEKDTCNRIDDLLRKLRVAMMKASVGQRPGPGGHGVEWWGEAWESVRSEVPPVLKELETQFRAFLSPKLTTDAQQMQVRESMPQENRMGKSKRVRSLITKQLRPPVRNG
jgi:hypothetical protein